MKIRILRNKISGRFRIALLPRGSNLLGPALYTIVSDIPISPDASINIIQRIISRHLDPKKPVSAEETIEQLEVILGIDLNLDSDSPG